MQQQGGGWNPNKSPEALEIQHLQTAIGVAIGGIGAALLKTAGVG